MEYILTYLVAATASFILLSYLNLYSKENLEAHASQGTAINIFDPELHVTLWKVAFQTAVWALPLTLWIGVINLTRR